MTTTDLDLNAATVVKIELEGTETTVLALDPDTVTIAVVPEPATGCCSGGAVLGSL